MSAYLDSHVWRACAGSCAKIPTAGALVYYFPHGHADQCTTAVDPSASVPFFLCRVVSVSYHANPDSDEVFAKIGLQPVHAHAPENPDPDPDPDPDPAAAGVVSFTKILTPSDANNGGGFSVPRFCADSIFPALDFDADPPVQTLTIKDVHGNTWDFRHIYRGTPRRHLLTTGWSRFVNSKILISGDSVVFIKNKNNADELSVGIRRTLRSAGGGPFLTPSDAGAEPLKKSGFSRKVKGRLSAESIMEAVRLAESGHPFEVVYYPMVGVEAFVVEKRAVERAMAVHWTAGMRVKMPHEAEDASRTTWSEGTVSACEGKTPWRMLQVTWDDAEVLKTVKTVSPWEVELVSASPHLQPSFPPTKKLRDSDCLNLFGEGQGNTLYPKSIFERSKMGTLAPSLLNYNTFPVGIQGARHDNLLSLSNFIPTNTHHLFSKNPEGINIIQELNESLSEGTPSPSQETIPQNSLAIVVPSFSPDLGVASSSSPTTRASKGGFRLFGTIVRMDQPSDDDETDSVGNEDVVLFSYTHKKSIRGLDTQTQTLSLLFEQGERKEGTPDGEEHTNAASQ